MSKNKKDKGFLQCCFHTDKFFIGTIRDIMYLEGYVHELDLVRIMLTDVRPIN